jgi:hypothetical protein
MSTPAASHRRCAWGGGATEIAKTLDIGRTSVYSVRLAGRPFSAVRTTPKPDRSRATALGRNQSHQERETRNFLFGGAFLVTAGKGRDGAWRRSIAEVIDRADTLWAGTRVTYCNSRRRHSPDH